MLDNATRTRASSFYQEGVYLSNHYVETYFDEETTKGTVSRIQTQLSSLSVYPVSYTHLDVYKRQLTAPYGQA